MRMTTACALAAWLACSVESLAQTPATVTPVAACNIEMSHAALGQLQQHFLTRDWDELQAALAYVRSRLLRDCPVTAAADLPESGDRILFSWIAAAADGVDRLHSAIQPSRRPYELAFGDSRGSQDRYFEVLLTNRIGLTVTARVTSELKESPLVAATTAFASTATGQLTSAVSAATVGVPSPVPAAPAAAAPEASVIGVQANPSTVASAGLSAAPRISVLADTVTVSAGDRPAPPPPAPPPAPPGFTTDEDELVMAYVRRVTVPHRVGSVKSVRKVTQPKLAEEIVDEFGKFAATLGRRWLGVPAVTNYLSVAAGVAARAGELCPPSSTADACRTALVSTLAQAASRDGMPPDVQAVDSEVRRYFAELARASHDEDLTLRNDRLGRIGFATVTAYLVDKDDRANARVKISSGGADFDPMPNALVGFGVSVAAVPYVKGSGDLSQWQRLRLGTGLVAAPNLGVFGTVGYTLLPRVGAVFGIASLRIPLEVQADRKNYIRGAARVVFLGIQVEFL